MWDRETGKPVYNAIVWQCRRTAELCEQIKADGMEEYIKDKTGLVIDAYFSGTKIKWILDNVPGARALAEADQLLYWVGMARITRSQILVLKESEYVTASRAFAAGFEMSKP